MASSDLPEVESSENRQSEEESAIAPSRTETSSDSLCVRFWGVRGSYPVPGNQTVEFGGNTACVEVFNGKNRVILDAGTGLIALGNLIMSEKRGLTREHGNQDEEPLNVTLLLSHTHFDHIQGLPFFEPAFSKSASLFVYGPQLLGVDLHDSLSQAMTGRNYPVCLEELSSQKLICNLSESEELRFENRNSQPEIVKDENGKRAHDHNGLLVQVLRSYAHPKDGVLVFKVVFQNKIIVYATDVEGYAGGDSRLIEFARDGRMET